MTGKPPPVPAENRSPKGTGSEPKPSQEKQPARENFDQQGRQGNIRQNTHNKGYQQDR